MIFIEEILDKIESMQLSPDVGQRLYREVLYEIYYELHHVILCNDNSNETQRRLKELIRTLKTKL